MPGDQLIGNVIQVIAHDLRLRADAQDIVAGPLDQRRTPPRRDGAERVQVWQAIRQSWDGSTPSSLST